MKERDLRTSVSVIFIDLLIFPWISCSLKSMLIGGTAVTVFEMLCMLAART